MHLLETLARSAFGNPRSVPQQRLRLMGQLILQHTCLLAAGEKPLEHVFAESTEGRGAELDAFVTEAASHYEVSKAEIQRRCYHVAMLLFSEHIAKEAARIDAEADAAAAEAAKPPEPPPVDPMVEAARGADAARRAELEARAASAELGADAQDDDDDDEEPSE